VLTALSDRILLKIALRLVHPYNLDYWRSIRIHWEFSLRLLESSVLFVCLLSDIRGESYLSKPDKHQRSDIEFDDIHYAPPSSDNELLPYFAWSQVTLSSQQTLNPTSRPSWPP
jgi:hypothetical protein